MTSPDAIKVPAQPDGIDFDSRDARTEWTWDCMAGGVRGCLHDAPEELVRRWAAEKGGRALQRWVGPWAPVPAPEGGTTHA